MSLIYAKVCYSLLYIIKLHHKTNMDKVMLELFVRRYLLTEERTNADRDHKRLSKTHKIDTLATID